MEVPGSQNWGGSKGVRVALFAALTLFAGPWTASAAEVQVPGFRFDPLADGEPLLPPDLRVPLADLSRPGFRLVQLKGPPQDDWLSELGGAGARVLQYYPHDTYLVWAGPAAGEALSNLDFVRWQGAFHPAYKINSDLLGRTGKIGNVDVMFFNDPSQGDQKATLNALVKLGAEILQVYPSQPDKAFFNAIVRLDAGALRAVAGIGNVLWLGYESPRPVLNDEVSSQIVAGNHPGGTPVTGYLGHLSSLGVDGGGVTWAVVDSGVDYDHPDLGGRIVGGFSFPGIPAGCDTGATPGNDCVGGGHGTHVAGILGGDATAGFTDPLGFLYGLGVAPGSGIFAMNSLSGGAWPPAGGWQEHSKRALLGGAVGANNSWQTGEATPHGYQASERTHDLMVRDGNFDTAGVAEPFIEVFSAGNMGPNPLTLTAPHEAKNLIVVAASRSSRAGGIDTLADFSSRGPAVDGRIVPTIAAPGEGIASSANDGGGSCSTPIAGTGGVYAFCSGTSMAAPHVAGAVVLLTEWWRGFNLGANPSPAMAKALLVNGAVDMGPADVPNAGEGWGRVSVTNVIDPPAPALYWDQTSLLDTAGESFQVRLRVPDPGQPVKVTLAWTDAAGAVGANPALVNDLDLTVVNGASTYRGNRFTAGWSVPGGAPDVLNNLENVFLQSPGGGNLVVAVAATALNGDGVPNNGDLTDQDFALVCTNCELVPDFTLGVAPRDLAVCAPASAVYTVSAGSIRGFAAPVTLSASGHPPGTTAAFSPNPVAPGGSSTLTLSGTGSPSATAGPYTIQVDATSTTGTRSRTANLVLLTAVPSAVTLLAPAGGAAGQPVLPTFTWQPAGEGVTYTLEVASDAAFTSLVATASGLTTTSHTLTAPLATRTPYYWRVRAANVCGAGGYSGARVFSTVAPPGECPVGTGASPLLTTGFEAGAPGWTHGGTRDSWALSNARVHGGATAFHAGAPGLVSDQSLVSPAVTLPGSAVSVALKFWNHQTLESRPGGCYDGAVVEISTNGGASWTRLQAELLTDPYDGPVSGCCRNPLAGASAWCGDPRDWTRSVVDLTAFKGQTVRLRFRVATDDGVGREGWYIDDVAVESCSSQVFSDGFEKGDISAWSQD